jgi:hypothetical protein
MTRFAILAALLLLSPGCAIKKKVDAYQQRTTEACQKHHSVEECKPLPYPSCIPGEGCR